MISPEQPAYIEVQLPDGSRGFRSAPVGPSRVRPYAAGIVAAPGSGCGPEERAPSGITCLHCNKVIDWDDETLRWLHVESSKLLCRQKDPTAHAFPAPPKTRDRLALRGHWEYTNTPDQP
ncbi:MAG: hypothetical protein ACRDQ0_20585 [Pseudonocardia sp.]